MAQGICFRQLAVLHPNLAAACRTTIAAINRVSSSDQTLLAIPAKTPISVVDRQTYFA